MDRALLKLYAATFFFVMLMATGFPLVPQHLDDTFGASVLFIGAVSGLYGFMQIFLRLPMGDMADRGGRKRSLVATFLLSAVAGLFYVFGPSKWWIVPAQAIFGLSSGIFWVAANAYLFDRVAEADVPTATSNYALAIGAAFLVGPPLGGWLADAIGYGAGLSVYLWGSAVGLVLVATLPETREPGTSLRPSPDVYKRGWRIFKDPDIRISAFGTVLFGLFLGVLSSFYPVYIRFLAFTAFVVGVLIALRQVVAMVLRAWIPGWVERFGPRNVLMSGAFAGAVSIGLTPFAPTIVDAYTAAPIVPLASLGLSAQQAVLGLLMLLAVVAGFAVGVMVPANLTLVSRGSPPDERGLANGIYGTALGLGTGFSQWILGGVGEWLGIEWTFWGAMAMVVVGLGFLIPYARANPPRTDGYKRSEPEGEGASIEGGEGQSTPTIDEPGTPFDDLP